MGPLCLPGRPGCVGGVAGTGKAGIGLDSLGVDTAGSIVISAAAFQGYSGLSLQTLRAKAPEPAFLTGHWPPPLNRVSFEGVDPTLHRRASELVQRAMSLPVASRAGFLEHETKDDPPLSDAVRVLVAERESATIAGSEERLFEEPTRERAEHLRGIGEAESASPAVSFGRYRLIRVLGEGGMGVVHLAEQDRPKRLIALKVIRPGFVTPAMLRRFEFESAVLAKLSHPGIAQVFDAGTVERGMGPEPFFAMEYIEGRTLAEWAATETVEARIRLFRRVCSAVSHAHQRGIIHRDLKPANILVTTAGDPKILDFGVARAMEGEDRPASTLATMAGQLVGTLPYMSPEQVSGAGDAVDVRSDVYTLGLILFELLSGRSPRDLRNKTVPEAVRAIGEEDPERLSRLAPVLRGDLDTIVAKALERSPDARYQSAADLSEDLRRHLEHEPILARRPSLVYQLRKFAQRRRGLVAAIGAAATIFAAGVAGTIWQAVEATKGRALAERESSRARQEAEIAAEINDFLSGMLASADPENALGKEPTISELVDRAALDIDRRFDDKPRTEAALRDTIGRTLRGVGRLEDAHRQYVEVVRLFEELEGSEGRNTLTARRNLCSVLGDRGMFKEAEELMRSVIETSTRVYGAKDPETLIARGELGRVMHESGNMAEAERLYRESLVACLPILGERDRAVMTMFANLGVVLKDTGKFDEAVEMLEKATSLRTEVLGRDHPDTLSALNGLGTALQRAGRFDEAAGFFEEGLAARRRVFGPKHPATMTAAMNLGQAYVVAGKLDRGEPLLREAYEVWKETLGESHPKMLIAMNALGFVAEDTGRPEEAEKWYRRVVELRRSSAGGNDPETWGAMNNLAMFLQHKGDFAAALEQFDELMTLTRERLPDDHYLSAIFRNNYGDCLREAGQIEKARAELTSSLASLEKALGASHARTEKARARLKLLEEQNGTGVEAQRPGSL